MAQNYNLTQTGEQVQELLNQVPLSEEAIVAIQRAIADFVTSAQVQTAINTALQPYSTTAEMAQAIATAINAALVNYYTKTAIDAALAEKQNKEAGKGLSTEDFTTALKNKLNGLPTYAELTQQIQTAINAAVETEATLRSQAVASERQAREAADTQLQQLINNVSNNLVNYYLKSETYSKDQVNAIVDNIKQFKYEVAATLPQAGPSTMGIIYLIPAASPKQSDIKDEYLTILDGATYKWEKIGQTTIDLSNYPTFAQMNAAISQALQSYYTKTEVDNLLATKVTAAQVAQAISTALADYYTKTEVNSAIASEKTRAEGAEATLQDNINTVQDLVAFINKSFGKYDGETQKVLSQAKAGKYVNVNGGETTASGYGISNPVSLNAGDILLVPSAQAVPADVSVIARLVDRTYQKVIAYIYTYRTDYPELPATATADYDATLVYTAVYDEMGDTPVLTGWTRGGQTYTTLPATREVNEQFYEPLMKQAVAAMPSTGYYIYLCPTAMTIVVSGLTATVSGGTALVVGWGIFKNITTNFVGAPGQSVLAQAFAVLFAAIDGLKAQLDNLGETKAVSIDFEEQPKLCGQAMVIEGAGAPASPIVPTMVGQRYHDTTNNKCYEAFRVTNSISDWVLLN